MERMNLDLGLRHTHVLVTGAGGLIGRQTVAAFLQAGSKVSALDISLEKLDALQGDIEKVASIYPVSAQFLTVAADTRSESELSEAFAIAQKQHGPIRCCVALAALDLSVLEHHQSIIDMPIEQFRRTLDVNITGTFITARLWLAQLAKAPTAAALQNKGLIIIGSESGSFGDRTNADYATSKSAVQGGLLQSLKADVPRTVPGARVNAVAPGPVDTARFKKECDDDPDQLWRDAQATYAF